MFHTSSRLGDLGKSEFWGLPIYLEVHLDAYSFGEEEVRVSRDESSNLRSFKSRGFKLFKWNLHKLEKNKFKFYIYSKFSK